MKELLLLIQAYRKHVLFIPETRFHREISRTIQSILNQIIGLGKLQKKHEAASVMNLGSQMTFHFESAYETPAEAQTPRMIRERIIGLLPDHHSWEGCIFQFNDSDLPNIMEQLIWSGYLDCSIPDALFTIACKIQRRPFGQTSLKLVIGYIYDIL